MTPEQMILLIFQATELVDEYDLEAERWWAEWNEAIPPTSLKSIPRATGNPWAGVRR